MFDTLWHHGHALLQWGVVCGASLAAALDDIRRRKIPNLLTMPLWAAGLAAAWATAGPAGLADAFVASVVLALPYVLLHVLARGGAGDAKMMAGVGAWLGVINGLAALAAVSLAGVVLAIAYAALKRQASASLRQARDIALALPGRLLAGWQLPAVADGKSLRMPYAVAICLGCFVAAAAVAAWRAGTPG